MTFKPEISLGDVISAGSFLVAAVALFLTLYQLRRDAVRKRVEFTVSALTAQLATLIQIQAMPDERKQATWDAIASAPGGPGKGFPVERAIAIQIQYLDQVAQGEEITGIPTYGI
mgnify:CR=1 FL=1